MKIAIVGSLHGDEVFGKKVCDFLLENPIENVTAAVGNPFAVAKNQRYIETDLNRSFNVEKPESLEERLAQSITKFVADYDYVIDIHTTTSELMYISIVPDLHQPTRYLLSHLEEEKVALMKSEEINKSLIGTAKNGISLEFNETYAQTAEALGVVITFLRSIAQTNKLGPHTKKQVYEIQGTIPNDIQLDIGLRNFQHSEKHDFYPLLLGEKSYVDYQGFFAKKIIGLQIS